MIPRQGSSGRSSRFGQRAVRLMRPHLSKASFAAHGPHPSEKRKTHRCTPPEPLHARTAFFTSLWLSHFVWCLDFSFRRDYMPGYIQGGGGGRAQRKKSSKIRRSRAPGEEREEGSGARPSTSDQTCSATSWLSSDERRSIFSRRESWRLSEYLLVVSSTSFSTSRVSST